jgi:hypothetical protein
MPGSSWGAARLPASQEGLSSMSEWVNICHLITCLRNLRANHFQTCSLHPLHKWASGFHNHMQISMGYGSESKRMLLDECPSVSTPMQYSVAQWRQTCLSNYISYCQICFPLSIRCSLYSQLGCFAGTIIVYLTDIRSSSGTSLFVLHIIVQTLKKEEYYVDTVSIANCA